MFVYLYIELHFYQHNEYVDKNVIMCLSLHWIPYGGMPMSTMVNGLHLYSAFLVLPAPQTHVGGGTGVYVNKLSVF